MIALYYDGTLKHVSDCGMSYNYAEYPEINPGFDSPCDWAGLKETQLVRRTLQQYYVSWRASPDYEPCIRFYAPAEFATDFEWHLAMNTELRDALRVPR